MLGGWHRRVLATSGTYLSTLASSYSLWVSIKMCAWFECHLWHMSVLRPYAEWYLKYVNWARKYAHVCVCTAFFHLLFMQIIALTIISSPAYLPMWKLLCGNAFCCLNYAPHIQKNYNETKDNAVWHGKWRRMLLTVYRKGILSFHNELSAWEHIWRQLATERYLRKLSAYKWGCSYCMFCSSQCAPAGVCTFLFFLVINVAFQLSASQPAMWSLSKLIKLAVVPNSD